MRATQRNTTQHNSKCHTAFPYPVRIDRRVRFNQLSADGYALVPPSSSLRKCSKCLPCSHVHPASRCPLARSCVSARQSPPSYEFHCRTRGSCRHTSEHLLNQEASPRGGKLPRARRRRRRKKKKKKQAYMNEMSVRCTTSRRTQLPASEARRRCLSAPVHLNPNSPAWTDWTYGWMGHAFAGVGLVAVRRTPSENSTWLDIPVSDR
ncbi:hypothetical protein LY76DRAFT_65583 [Colletotrichum caudatum]|nr:hypothetical protein LY76DRAFT_65583 [Colletotrichum caudatum]